MAISMMLMKYIRPLLIVGTSWATVASLEAFKLGVENISDSFLHSLSPDKNVRSYKVGLISNQTGCDQRGNRTIDILLKRGLNITYILAPEHGFCGTVLAGKVVPNSIDRKTGIPVMSMYSTAGDFVISNGKRINPTILSNIDVLFFDIQDSGMRHYTYISTLFYALEAAAQYGKKIVVLDRPNILGANMEGPVVDASLRSFIGLVPIPLRHGMTIGELAWFFNANALSKPAELYVIKMKDYVRTMKLSSLRAGLSPNLKTLSACYGYSFLGLMGEVEPFDTCIGTSQAFQVIALPDSHNMPSYEWTKLHAIFARHGIKSSHYEYYSRTRKQALSGLQFTITDISALSSFNLLIELLQFFKDCGVALKFSATFDKAVGMPLVRALCNGTCDRAQLVSRVNNDLDQFMEKAKSSFMYTPRPKPIKLI